MPLMEHNDLSDELSTIFTNEPFDVWVPPRTPWRNRYFVNTQMLHPLPKVRGIDAVPIIQGIAWRVVSRKCFHDLLCGPLHR
jgi:hypothetical protein